MNITNLIKRIKKFGIFETIILILFTIIVLLLAVTHECYQEEAQSWLIARDLNPIQVIQQLKYEGHSFLWFFILMPFAKIGLPMQTQNIITAIIAILGAYRVLKSAPFSKVGKLLILFSGGMIYFYSAIARPYALAVLILYEIASMYSERKLHPYKYSILLAILAQTHLVMLPVVFWLTVFFWGHELFQKDCSKEYRKTLLKSFSIVAVSMIIFLIICVFTLFNCDIIKKEPDVTKTFIEKITTRVQDEITVTTAQLIGTPMVKRYYKYIIAIPFLLCVIGSKKNFKFAIIFWSQVLFSFCVHAFGWKTIVLRVYMVIYMLIFWMWLYKSEYKKNNVWLQVAFILFLVITTVPSYKIAIQDVFGNYSNGRDTAEFIENNIEKGACFICTENETHQSVIGYLPKDEYKFFQMSSQSYFTYITWNKEWNSYADDKTLEDTINKLKNEYDNLYLICIYPMEYEGTDFVYSTKEDIINNIYNQNGREEYYIYKAR